MSIHTLRMLLRRLFPAALCLGFWYLPGSAQVVWPPPFVKEGELAVMSPEGDLRVKLDIEIAESAAELYQGLMYRESMEDLQGMLFVFAREEEKAFWMKNTPLSLDILFVDASGRIVTICRDTVPYSEESYSSGGRVKYVLEVVAGTAGRCRISVGDRIYWQRM